MEIQISERTNTSCHREIPNVRISKFPRGGGSSGETQRVSEEATRFKREKLILGQGNNMNKGSARGKGKPSSFEEPKVVQCC